MLFAYLTNDRAMIACTYLKARRMRNDAFMRPGSYLFPLLKWSQTSMAVRLGGKSIKNFSYCGVLVKFVSYSSINRVNSVYDYVCYSLNSLNNTALARSSPTNPQSTSNVFKTMRVVWAPTLTGSVTVHLLLRRK